MLFEFVAKSPRKSPGLMKMDKYSPIYPKWPWFRYENNVLSEFVSPSFIIHSELLKYDSKHVSLHGRKWQKNTESRYAWHPVYLHVQ